MFNPLDSTTLNTHPSAAWIFRYPMYKILQLSDTHINKNKDMFNCTEKFERTLKTALAENADVDLIAVTGDLADADYNENYSYIKHTLDMTGIQYMVIPGNHDSVADMLDVFGVHTINPIGGYRVFNRMLFWNNCPNSDGVCPEFPAVMADRVRIVFCHYPLGNIPHELMVKYSIPADVANKTLAAMQETGVTHVFCGHYHWSHIPNQDDPVKVFVAPAIQRQLYPTEPTSKNADMRPGYAILELSENGEYCNYIPKIIEV